MEALDQQMGSLVRRFGKASMLLVIEPGAPLASEEVRRSALAMLRELGPRVATVAIVLEGGGFWAGAVRSVFNGLALALRPKFEWRVFADCASALSWQLHSTEAGVPGAAVIEMISNLRALRANV